MTLLRQIGLAHPPLAASLIAWGQEHDPSRELSALRDVGHALLGALESWHQAHTVSREDVLQEIVATQPLLVMGIRAWSMPMTEREEQALLTTMVHALAEEVSTDDDEDDEEETVQAAAAAMRSILQLLAMSHRDVVTRAVTAWATRRGDSEESAKKLMDALLPRGECPITLALTATGIQSIVQWPCPHKTQGTESLTKLTLLSVEAQDALWNNVLERHVRTYLKEHPAESETFARNWLHQYDSEMNDLWQTTLSAWRSRTIT